MVPRLPESRRMRSAARALQQAREYRKWRGAFNSPASIRPLMFSPKWGLMLLSYIGMLLHSNSYSTDISSAVTQASCGVVTPLQQLQYEL